MPVASRARLGDASDECIERGTGVAACQHLAALVGGSGLGGGGGGLPGLGTGEGAAGPREEALGPRGLPGLSGGPTHHAWVSPGDGRVAGSLDARLVSHATQGGLGIDGHESCPSRGDDTTEECLGRDELASLGGDWAVIDDTIATSRESDASRVGFVRCVRRNNAEACRAAAGRRWAGRSVMVDSLVFD